VLRLESHKGDAPRQRLVSLASWYTLTITGALIIAAQVKAAKDGYPQEVRAGWDSGDWLYHVTAAGTGA
jgi:hypothetical protein